MIVAQISEKNTISLDERELPTLPEGGALVRMTGCGLCGSDLDKLVNNKARPGTVLGHEIVGCIESLGEGHDSSFSVGDRVITSHHVPCGQCHFCVNGSESMCRDFKATNLNPGGFSQVIALTKGHLHNTVFQVPDSITDEEASCMEPLACVLRAVRRGGLGVNATVGVVGLGFIGLLAAQCYQIEGANVVGFDIADDRMAFAHEKGFVQEDSGQKLDLVFLTAVTSGTLALAFERLRDGGTLVLFTSPASAGTTLDPNLLYFREINVISSYSPALEDLKRASELIFEKRIDVQSLVSHTLPMEKLNEAIELYKSGKAMKVLVTP